MGLPFTQFKTHRPRCADNGHVAPTTVTPKEDDIDMILEYKKQKPRYVIIGCDVGNPYYFFNEKTLTKQEAVSMYSDRGNMIIAIVRGRHTTRFEVSLEQLCQYEFIYGEEFEYSGNMMDYFHTIPDKPLLTVLHIIKDPSQSIRYHCVDSDGKGYMLTSNELKNHTLTNVRVYVEEPEEPSDSNPIIKVETIGSKIPEYTTNELNTVTAEAEEEAQSGLSSVQKKAMQLDQILGLYEHYEVNWDTQTLVESHGRIEEFDSPSGFPPVKFIGPEVLIEAGVKKLEIPDTLEAIGRLSFRGLAIKELVIGPSLKRIGDGAFDDTHLRKLTLNCCKELTLEKRLGCEWNEIEEINVGPDVANLESILSFSKFEEAWYSLSFHELQAINVSPDNPYYTSIDGVLYNKDVTQLLHFPHHSPIEHYVMPDTVKEFNEILTKSEGPFENRSSLKSVKLSDSLTSLPTRAFYITEPLEYIDLGKGIKEIDKFGSLCTRSLKIIRFHNELNLHVDALCTSCDMYQYKVYFVTCVDSNQDDNKEPVYSIKGSFRFPYFNPVFVYMPMRENYKRRSPLYYKPTGVIDQKDYIYFDRYVFNRSGTMKEMEEACTNYY